MQNNNIIGVLYAFLNFQLSRVMLLFEHEKDLQSYKAQSHSKGSKGPFTPRMINIKITLLASRPTDDIVLFILSVCLSATLNA